MGAKDRHLLHKFLLGAPVVVGAVITFAVTTALLAADQWPDAKDWVAARFFEARSLMTWWTLGTAIAIALIWLWAVLATRDRDDKALGGQPIGGGPVGDDKRKGIFNEASNHGTQNYYEGPQQRFAPPGLGAALQGIRKDGVTVQVRIYGMDHEMQTYGRDLAQKIAEAGFRVVLFDGDHGTRYLRGTVVEPAPNAPSQEAARAIVSALAAGGASTSLGAGPDAWSDQHFVRVGVGGNG